VRRFTALFFTDRIPAFAGMTVKLKQGVFMTIKIEEASRQQIAVFLPDAIAKAIASYHRFMDKTVNEEKAKEFAEHHNACKVAIAHIELLLKLARWADLPDATGSDHNRQIAAMMREAENKLAEYRGESGEDLE
jgi:hypothetical protein